MALVWSSDGNICKKCSHKQCICCQVQIKGKIKVQKETKGRAGKSVVCIYNLPLEKEILKILTTKIKKKFSVGGTLKDSVIEIQSDKIEDIKIFLKSENLL